MSVIIIEGIDRVGKTTLALKLKKELNAKILKDATIDGRLTKEIVSEKINTTVNLLTLWPKNDILIVDRFHLSELVYGYLDRRYNNLHMLNVDEMLSKLDVKLVLVNPTDVEKSSKEHGSDLSIHDKLFRQFYNDSKIKKKKQCDYNSLDETVEWLKGVL